MSGVLERLAKINVLRCETAFKHTLNSWSVAEWTNAMAGEAGEACNIAKKMLRFRDGVAGNKLTRDEYKALLATELSDVVIYADLTAASEDIDLCKAIVEAFNNKSKELRSPIML